MVVPEKYRKNLMTIDHEATVAHLRVTKTKNAIFKTFYSPKCFSDVEDIVKTCGKCQRVGKPQDKKKAPLQIVPVITEIFTKINIDESGTLPMTPTVIHDSTGFSPAELVHGKNLRTPVMLLYEKLTEEPVESSVVDYVFEHINRMKICQESAILHMEDAKQKQMLWYDSRTVKRQFQPSELVLVIAPSRPNKLSVQLVGPGEIVQQLPETSYVVKFPEKDKTLVYHVNLLKPYHQLEENINLLCINPLKHDEEEDIPSLELENEMSVWSKIISDVQLNSKLSQIQRGKLKELLYEYSNLFSNIPGCTD
ncbi:retrovirus-related Pol polyprotein from transposon 412 [Trichonephila clavipes]|nr:retrovirus-related Pol polyprotein from transposon 412 [Trichonephila clavipes]